MTKSVRNLVEVHTGPPVLEGDTSAVHLEFTDGTRALLRGEFADLFIECADVVARRLIAGRKRDDVLSEIWIQSPERAREFRLGMRDIFSYSINGGAPHDPFAEADVVKFPAKRTGR